MASPGNQHCVHCIGTLSFPIDCGTWYGDAAITSIRALFTATVRVPSNIVIFDGAVPRTVGGKLGCLVDDRADGRFAEQVAGAAGRVTVRQSLPYQLTEINRRISSIFAENVQQVLPHDVSVSWSVELNKHDIWPRVTRKKCLNGVDFA